MNLAVYFILGAFLLIAGLVIFLRNLHANAMQKVSVEYPEHERVLISPMANLFGIGSAGMKQVRGNGILLLTASQIYFRMLIPKKEILIPVRSIISIETPKSFLGKTKGMKLLKIDYRNDTGGTGSAAWMVDNLDKWVEILREAVK